MTSDRTLQQFVHIIEFLVFTNGTLLQYSCLENPMDGRSLVGYSPWGRQESDTTERLHFHFSLSCIGGGNGNPLQCSCLENPRDGGAWWAAVYGVTESRTRLKRLSSSSSTSKKGTGSCPFVMNQSLMAQLSLYKIGDRGSSLCVAVRVEN